MNEGKRVVVRKLKQKRFVGIRWVDDAIKSFLCGRETIIRRLALGRHHAER